MGQGAGVRGRGCQPVGGGGSAESVAGGGGSGAAPSAAALRGESMSGERVGFDGNSSARKQSKPQKIEKIF